MEFKKNPELYFLINFLNHYFYYTHIFLFYFLADSRINSYQDLII